MIIDCHYHLEERVYNGKVDFNLNNKITMVIKDSTMKYLKEDVI